MRKEYVCPTCIADVWQGLDAEGFGHRLGYILRSCAFQQLDVAIAHDLTQIMHSSVDMPSALPISRIFAHHNTRCIIFPYFCGADLSEIETTQSEIGCDSLGCGVTNM
jgi:hypothetical protein